MTDEMRENKAFISFNGFMGRYDYFLNLVLLNMIALVFTIPLTGYFLTGAGTVDSLFNLNNIFNLAPLWAKTWGIIGSTTVSYIIISNVIRRLNDINGKEDKRFNIAIATVFALTNFSYIFPNILAIGFCLIGTIVAFWVLLKKVKSLKKCLTTSKENLTGAHFSELGFGDYSINLTKPYGCYYYGLPLGVSYLRYIAE